ncbi:VOC family protein [Fulvivirgaceae bacterium BMA10]|uniref:VOC family protein n=1 Tax=Splendidivirga corallicola TaxID=3051826 RepID=A0ABT8KKD5_9BACT|nr:VOC family protein [Fulvivirgaceae bacterium BMA10]
MINICSDKLEESKMFYTNLFDFNVNYESDWFIHLISKDKQLELGIIDRKNEIVPNDSKSQPQGFYVTLVVDNADEVFDLAKSNGFDIEQAPEDTFYGQRRLLLKDPNGALIDVSAPIPNFSFQE